MPYQVDSTEGRCLYRGEDLELACELLDQEPTARLVTLPAVAGGIPAPRRAPAWTTAARRCAGAVDVRTSALR